MGVSYPTQNAIEAAIGDPQATKEIVGKPFNQQTLTVTATTGSLPTPNKAVVIADTATPTVVELLEYCHELRNILKQAGIIS